jgi:hypothetical protein
LMRGPVNNKRHRSLSEGLSLRAPWRLSRFAASCNNAP